MLALRTGRKLDRPAAIANQMEDSDTTWRVSRKKGKEIPLSGKRPSRPLGAQEGNFPETSQRVGKIDITTPCVLAALEPAGVHGVDASPSAPAP